MDNMDQTKTNITKFGIRTSGDSENNSHPQQDPNNLTYGLRTKQTLIITSLNGTKIYSQP